MNVIEFTQALVRIPSTSDRLERPAAALVAARMREWGWQPMIEEVAPGRPNVVAVVEGGLPGRTLMFEGHTDVVTEGDLSEWTVDPFGGEIVDGRLYGRGSADMKSGVAAMMYGVRALQEAGRFPGRVVVAALADEEGMMLGAHHFAASSLAREVDAAIVGEPEGGEICPVAKGALRIGVTFHGKMAHGAMPRHGNNPIPAVARFVAELANLEDDLQAAFGAHEHLGDVYVTPTVVQAGSEPQMNVIPAAARVCVDVRTVPGVDHADVVRRVTAAAGSAPSLPRDHGIVHREGRVEVDVMVDRPPVDVPADHPVVAALAAAHTAVTGERPVYGGVPGSTDGTVLTHWGGIPSVVYGPGGKWIAHQADEYVEVAEIAQYADVYTEAARRYITA